MKNCPWFEEKINKFRRLPTPLLTMLVASRFVFGFGLGALIAASHRRQDWKKIGWVVMAAAVVLALPGAKRVLTMK